MIQFIDDHKDEFGVEPICRHLPIAPQTYYAAKGRPPSKRALSDEVMTEKIHQIHEANYGVYGVRKVHAELRRNGDQVARCTVERLMKREHLRGIRRAKGPRTTIPGPLADRPSDLVGRRFTAAAPDCLWVADITYIRTFSGWVYAAFVIDVIVACLALSSLLAVSGCASTAPSGWQIEPVIRAASGPHFFENHHVERDDVTFATQLIESDTAGGLWTTSVGTWLHINQAGDKPIPISESRTATSFVAEDTTHLVVAVNSLDGKTNSLYRFDTRRRTWTPLLSTKGWLADVALMANGTILFAVFPDGMPYPAYPQPFEVRTLATDGTDRVLVAAADPVASVSITVSDNNSVSVATNTGGFTRTNDGQVLPLPTPSRTNIPGASAILAANGRGDLISSIANPAHTEARGTIVAGSDEARSMLARPSWQDPESELSLTQNGSTTLLPFTRGAVAAAWLNETTLVFVIGGGGDSSVIAKTTIPSR